jgi:hypothetical protein
MMLSFLRLDLENLVKYIFCFSVTVMTVTAPWFSEDIFGS